MISRLKTAAIAAFFLTAFAVSASDTPQIREQKTKIVPCKWVVKVKEICKSEIYSGNYVYFCSWEQAGAPFCAPMAVEDSGRQGANTIPSPYSDSSSYFSPNPLPDVGFGTFDNDGPKWERVTEEQAERNREHTEKMRKDLERQDFQYKHTGTVPPLTEKQKKTLEFLQKNKPLP